MNERMEEQAEVGSAAHAGGVETPGQSEAMAEVEALAERNVELQDRLLRALAEMENIRRRAERVTHEARQYAIANFARELLPVADNLDRALEAARELMGKSEPESAIAEGVDATRRVLASTLAKFGVSKIDAVGAKFDPSLHEALMEVADETVPPGTVSAVVEEGYLLHGRLLRPARVIVRERRNSTD